jgi:hypothetical protein
MARRNLYTPLSPDADHGSERKGGGQKPAQAKSTAPNVRVRTANQVRTVACLKIVRADPTKIFPAIDFGAV